MHMKLKGSITVFLSIVLLSVILLVCVVIESARVSVSQSESKAYAHMAVDSVFAGYARQLYEDYGILFVWEKQKLDDAVMEYMQSNIAKADVDNDTTDILKTGLSDVQIKRQKYAVDNGGEIFINQVMDFTKYAFAKDAINDLVEKINSYKDSDKKSEEIDNNAGKDSEPSQKEIEEVQEKVEKLDKAFGKMKDTKTLKKKMSGVSQKLAILESDIKGGSVSKDTHDKNVRKFVKKYIRLKNQLDKDYKSIIDTLGMINDYETKKDQIQQKYEIKSDDSGSDYILEDKIFLREAKILTEEVFQEKIEDYTDINSENLNKIITVFKKIKNIESKLWNLKTRTVTEQNRKDKSLYEKAKALLNDGALNLIIDDVDELSLKAVNEEKLPSKRQSDKSNNLLKNTKNKAVFAKYLELYFNNYCENNEERDTALSYEMEYILGGKNKDRDNLSATLKKLVTTRNALNIAYILTDKEKMYEIQTISVSAATAIGVPFLSFAIKAVLIEAWAMTESVIDVRDLVRNGKVQLMKNKNTWKSSLTNLGDYGGSNNGDKGLSYTEYLQILILCQNVHKTVFRTMDLIQLNMQKMYNSEFLMERCYGECDISVQLSINPVFTAIPMVVAFLNNSDGSYNYNVNVSYSY